MHASRTPNKTKEYIDNFKNSNEWTMRIEIEILMNVKVDKKYACFDYYYRDNEITTEDFVNKEL